MRRYIKSHTTKGLRVRCTIEDKKTIALSLRKKFFWFIWYQVDEREVKIDRDHNIRMEAMNMIDNYKNKYTKVREALKNLEP